MIHEMTNVTAGAALFSPLWLPTLTAVSSFASIVLPILGAAWLIVQITAKVIEMRRARKK